MCYQMKMVLVWSPKADLSRRHLSPDNKWKKHWIIRIKYFNLHTLWKMKQTFASNSSFTKRWWRTWTAWTNRQEVVQLRNGQGERWLSWEVTQWPNCEVAQLRGSPMSQSNPSEGRRDSRAERQERQPSDSAWQMNRANATEQQWNGARWQQTSNYE